jgi:hypothetical protein
MENISFAHAFDKPRRLKGGSVQDLKAKSNFNRGTQGKVGREYEEEKREVNTGPNPPHNR